MKSFTAALLFANAMAFEAEKIDIYTEKQLVNDSFVPLDITVDGETRTFYIATDSELTPGGATATMTANGRGYLHEEPTLDSSNPKFWTPNLKDASVEWDVDLSNHECGCIAAFYLVSMPGKDQSGNYWMDTDGYGYCDANQVAGNWCPEMDLMEADKYSWASTPHTCDAPSDKGFYWHCDQGGTCQQNIVDALAWNGYGPGDQYTINTNKPFHAKIDMHSGSFSTTLTQEDRTQVMTCNNGYMDQMAQDLENGMGFVISNWGGDASWLWKDRCSGTCNWPELSISNINITSGVSPGPGPSPSPIDPSDYDFGDACGGIVDYCSEMGCSDVSHCRWSWAKDDPQKWSGDTAACRCDYV